jgi:GTP-binding protein
MKSVPARFVKGVASWQQMPDSGIPEVAFIGRSNVGKSSLVNTLLGHKNLAHTSNSPGKTREFNFYLVDDRLYFVDVPGYGYAKTSKTERDRWAALITRYLSEREQLKVMFHLIDSRHAPTDYDREVMDYVKGSPIPYVVCLTKTDKLSGNERNRSVGGARTALLERGMEAPIILTSAQNGRGREEVWDWINALVV